MFSKKQQKVLGIDFTKDAIYVVGLRQQSGLLYLEDILQLQVDDLVKDQTLAKLGKAYPVIATALPNASVLSKTLSYPAVLTDAELAEQVFFDAKQLLPQADIELAVDFTHLGLNKNNPQLADILLIVCRQEEVKTRFELMRSLGVQPQVIDVEAFALARSYTGLELETNIALVDLQKHKLSLVILEQRQIIFRREEVLTQALNAEQLALQIRTSLQFFSTLHSQVEISQIMLGGNLIGELNLVLLENLLNIPVYLSDPFKGIQVKENIYDSAAKFCIAAGLARRGLQHV